MLHVDCHILGIQSGDYTIPVGFDGNKVSGGGANVVRIVVEVPLVVSWMQLETNKELKNSLQCSFMV